MSIRSTSASAVAVILLAAAGATLLCKTSPVRAQQPQVRVPPAQVIVPPPNPLIYDAKVSQHIDTNCKVLTVMYIGGNAPREQVRTQIACDGAPAWPNFVDAYCPDALCAQVAIGAMTTHRAMRIEASHSPNQNYSIGLIM